MDFGACDRVDPPVIAYGGLGWFAFRRFYRVQHREALGRAVCRGAAHRRAGPGLSIEPVRGRELGRLSKTLEAMRASLLQAQREAAGATAEERRRLNAAFAHDMRTPVTVPRGTVEMAKMRLARGAEVDERRTRHHCGPDRSLGHYAQAMSGVRQAGGPSVEREGNGRSELVRRLRALRRRGRCARAPAS